LVAQPYHDIAPRIPKLGWHPMEASLSGAVALSPDETFHFKSYRRLRCLDDEERLNRFEKAYGPWPYQHPGRHLGPPDMVRAAKMFD